MSTLRNWLACQNLRNDKEPRPEFVISSDKVGTVESGMETSSSGYQMGQEFHENY